MRRTFHHQPVCASKPDPEPCDGDINHIIQPSGWENTSFAHTYPIIAVHHHLSFLPHPRHARITVVAAAPLPNRPKCRPADPIPSRITAAGNARQGESRSVVLLRFLTGSWGVSRPYLSLLFWKFTFIVVSPFAYPICVSVLV